MKNKNGGKGHKKMARKHLNVNTHREKTRFPLLDGELFAVVTKVYGGGMFEVMCNDGVSRLCVMRNRFKHRNKRDNNVTLHGLLLVGLREWEVLEAKKKPKCDLLYVYSEGDYDDVKEHKDYNKKILGENDNNDTSIVFSDDEENNSGYGYDINNIIISDKNENDMENTNKSVDNDDDFDFNDI